MENAYARTQTYYTEMYTGSASSSQYYTVVAVHRPNPLDVGMVAVLLTALQGRLFLGTLQQVRFRTLQRVLDFAVGLQRVRALTICTSVRCVSFFQDGRVPKFWTPSRGRGSLPSEGYEI